MSRSREWVILDKFVDTDYGMARAEWTHYKAKYKGQADVQVCFATRGVRAFLAYAEVYVVVARREVKRHA